MKYLIFCCLSTVCFSSYSMEKSNPNAPTPGTATTMEDVVKDAVAEHRDRLERLKQNPVISKKSKRRERHNGATVHLTKYRLLR